MFAMRLAARVGCVRVPVCVPVRWGTGGRKSRQRKTREGERRARARVDGAAGAGDARPDWARWHTSSLAARAVDAGVPDGNPARLVDAADVVHVKVLRDTRAKGQGRQAVEGDVVTLDVTGYLGPLPLSMVAAPLDTPLDLPVFLSRSGHSYTIGSRKGPKAWHLALLGARKGHVLRVMAPPAYAHGADGDVELGIPPDTSLVYDVTVVDV